MKRDPLAIMEKIFQALEEGRTFTLHELSKETGLHHLTVRRYVQIIETVRREPEVEIIKTSHSIVVRTRKTETRMSVISEV